MEASLEKVAVFSKSLALIERTKARILQIDVGLFPTSATKEARSLLIKALDIINDPRLNKQMAPWTLYNKLIKMQLLVNNVEMSTIDHISWPLVNYCNDIWEAFFGSGWPKMFYTITHAHNYGISSFSYELSSILSGILPVKIINDILQNHQLYCLHLSSMEETNLPLYANIAHEFGHALFQTHRKVFSDLWKEISKDLYQDMFASLLAYNKKRAPQLMERIKAITLGIAEEMLSDLFAALVMGPAFVLSLYEMSWGAEGSIWPISLSPNLNKIIAYPSYDFRLRCINDLIDINNFDQDSKKKFGKVKNETLQQITYIFTKMTTNGISEEVKIKPESDNDRSLISKTMNSFLESLKICCKSFLAECKTFILKEYNNILSTINAHDVSELLVRIENDILPNIIPNKTLLGIPASFQAILNASALYRFHLLLKGNEIDRIGENIEKIERLAAKAFEVSYIQRKYPYKDKKG